MNKNSVIAGLVVIATIAVGVLLSFSSDSGKKNTSSNTDTKAELIREGAYYKGKKDAKVVIVEFSDFQCPACKIAETGVKQALENYGDKVVLYYRHFPLVQHPFSTDAAKAAESAGKQGKFWEMHDAIFENQSSLSKDIFDKFASELGLDMTKYEVDVASEDVVAIIKKDTSDAQGQGVKSTPTFFINGEKVEGSLGFDDWKAKIDAKLSE
ncbi:disulfide bond formation protein DsbA [bacterium (Candidatus Howlettbacteria) CG_4_10_14_0_8_um_filter_40_9]|nr:MAG: disulfide bond formation protein DsbA [bacterium (Candidatus Howlettbacteria) CG_4_10_14_0_8_um_filter_40_9]